MKKPNMKNALLVIDVQGFFLNEVTGEVPTRIARFIENNQDKFDFILFFKFINDINSNWVKILGWKRMLKPEETRIALDLRKFLKKDNVFVKKAAFSIFRVEEFKKFVKDKSISKFYICGMDTHACVYVSAMEAFERRFEVKVIEDLCAASHGMSYHQNAIDSLRRNLGKGIIINSKDIGKNLKKSSSTTDSTSKSKTICTK